MNHRLDILNAYKEIMLHHQGHALLEFFRVVGIQFHTGLLAPENVRRHRQIAERRPIFRLLGNTGIYAKDFLNDDDRASRCTAWLDDIGRNGASMIERGNPGIGGHELCQACVSAWPIKQELAR